MTPNPDNEENKDNQVAVQVAESPETIHHRTLKQLREKFHQFNIYIHMCNWCHEIGQLLHEQ